MSIRVKYEAELKEVHNKLVLMLRQVEQAIESAIKALVTRDNNFIDITLDSEKETDRLERDIEQECLKILLMEQPVASDFREVSAALKMITDLERIADQARDISDIVKQFKNEQYIKKLEHIPLMANIAISLVKDSVHAYINRDLQLARGLDDRDDEVDKMFLQIKDELVGLIKNDSSNAEQAMLFMMIAKYIERISDHAVNIGEWVDYAITGSHK